MENRPCFGDIRNFVVVTCLLLLFSGELVKYPQWTVVWCIDSQHAHTEIDPHVVGLCFPGSCTQHNMCWICMLCIHLLVKSSHLPKMMYVSKKKKSVIFLFQKSNRPLLDGVLFLLDLFLLLCDLPLQLFDQLGVVHGFYHRHRRQWSTFAFFLTATAEGTDLLMGFESNRNEYQRLIKYPCPV